MTKKTLIFDMDGTLLDSMGMWMELPKEIVKHKAIINELTPLEAGLKSMLQYSHDIIGHDFPEFQKEEVYALLDKYFLDFYGMGKHDKENVAKALEYFSNNGYEMYIATATDFKYANHAISSHGFSNYFKKIYTQDNVGFRKRDKEYFDYIINDLKIDPAQVLYFDDAYYALALAKEVGFETVGVQDAHVDNHDEVIEISDHYTYDFKKLIEEINLWNNTKRSRFLCFFFLELIMMKKNKQFVPVLNLSIFYIFIIQYFFTIVKRFPKFL